MKTVRRTTRGRVFLGIAVAVVLPSELFALAMMSTDPVGSVLAVIAVLAFAPLVGLVLGAPFLAVAAVAWWGLHRAGRHSIVSAVLVGLGVGAALAAVNYWVNAFGERSPITMAVTLLVGMLTGYAVWRIAYGDQKRFEIDTSAFD